MSGGAATTIQEAKDFAAAGKELMDIVALLTRVSDIFGLGSESEMQVSPAMMQLMSAANVIQASELMVQLSLISTSDAEKLRNFLQDAHKEHSSMSGGVVAAIQDLLEKADGAVGRPSQMNLTEEHEFWLLPKGACRLFEMGYERPGLKGLRFPQ